MAIVWEQGPVTVSQVQAVLSRRQPLAYTTVMTILGRLAGKGLLQRSLAGRAYLYSARVTREEMGHSIARGLVDGLLDDFARPALSYFVERLAREDEAALAELERLIAEQRAQGKE